MHNKQDYPIIKILISLEEGQIQSKIITEQASANELAIIITHLEFLQKQLLEQYSKTINSTVQS